MDEREEARRRERTAFGTYVIAELPGWLVGALALGLLYRLEVVPGWAAVLVLLLWIGSSLVMFPRVKHYYTPGPPSRPAAGATGIAQSSLDPRGFVRIDGELWQAIARDANATITEGARVRVLGAEGLRLTVEPDGQERTPP
jgi:membrane protein implicated in regulation of membrane protease activity